MGVGLGDNETQLYKFNLMKNVDFRPCQYIDIEDINSDFVQMERILNFALIFENQWYYLYNFTLFLVEN